MSVCHFSIRTLTMPSNCYTNRADKCSTQYHTCPKRLTGKLHEVQPIQTLFRQARLTIATHSEASLATHTPYCNPAIQTPYRQAPQCSYAQSSFASYGHTFLTAASLTKYPAIQTPCINVAMHSQVSLGIDTYTLLQQA